MSGKREVRHVYRDRKLTPEEAEHYRRIREQVEREIPPGSKMPPVKPDPDLPATQGDVWALHDLILDLKEERLRQNLTLQDIQQATGIDPAVLSRLETGKNLNPTFATLSRYAWALGKTLSMTLADRESETKSETKEKTMQPAEKARKAQ